MTPILGWWSDESYVCRLLLATPSLVALCSNWWIACVMAPQCGRQKYSAPGLIPTYILSGMPHHVCVRTKPYFRLSSKCSFGFSGQNMYWNAWEQDVGAISRFQSFNARDNMILLLIVAEPREHEFGCHNVVFWNLAPNIISLRRSFPQHCYVVKDLYFRK